MTTTRFSILIIALAVVLQLTSAQPCYTVYASMNGLTNCKTTPIFIHVTEADATTCNNLVCVRDTNDNVTNDAYYGNTRDLSAVPKPDKFIQFNLYSDDKCSSAVESTEYWAIGTCISTSGIPPSLATCDQSTPRVVTTDASCNSSVVYSNFTFPVGQCTFNQMRGKYALASCGTAADSTSPSTTPAVVSPVSAPVTSQTVNQSPTFYVSVAALALYCFM